ncbi:MAG TPA: D-alanyl-D-alanine carboxypeptidase family protein [Acidimicrobiia bacterium]
MKRSVLAVMTVLVFWSSALGAEARPLLPIERLPIPPPPEVTAGSWVLFDQSVGVELGVLGGDDERSMASTTKIMSALVAYELVQAGQRTIVSTRADRVGEAELGLVAGESIELRPLIDGLLIRSGNDAAIAVAEAIGGSVEGFVALMNQRAADMALAHTSFANPHGLDQPGHYSSARDLLTMAVTAMDDPRFAQAVATRRIRLPDAPDGTERILETTNRLLFDYPGAIGVKTGYTLSAGLVLVAAAERDGRRLYAVVMGSEGEGGHFEDARRLLDYGFDQLRVVPAVTQGASFRLVDSAEVDQMTAQAGLETLIHTAAMARTGLLPEPPAVETPEVVALSSRQLPDLASAFGWLLEGLR